MSDITRLQCFRHPKKWRCEIRCGTWLALLIKFFRPKGSNKLNKLNKLCNSAYHMIRSLLEFDHIWSIFHVFFHVFSLKKLDLQIWWHLCLFFFVLRSWSVRSLTFKTFKPHPIYRGNKLNQYKSVSTCMNQWINTWNVANILVNITRFELWTN